MAKTIGIVMTDHLVTGLLDDHKLVGDVRHFPNLENPAEADWAESLVSLPAEPLAKLLSDEIVALAPKDTTELAAVGVAVPGIVGNGVLEDSPNLPQLKGTRLGELVSAALKSHGIGARVHVMNDADAVAAGIAARRGQLDRLVRVWTLGNGIGFGRYPYAPGVWEGGHTVVSLDPKESYCGCGGKGHVEGIMGHRAMRLRFLDMEPEEVFAAAKEGDTRCRDFVKLWHRALAAGTASAIHIAGPGPFYYTGRNIGFLDLDLLKTYLQEMVKMGPLQSYKLEILQEDSSRGVVGAGAAAELALAW